MANQKITELQNLPSAQIADQDLLIIVDRDDFSSPTGESKNTTAVDYANYVKGVIGNVTRTSEKIYQLSNGFLPGDVLRRATTGGAYLKASSDVVPNAEAIGIVESIDSNDSNYFTIVYSGVIKFASNPRIDTGFAPLADGTVYFLASNGRISVVDPTQVVSNSGYVSKPMLVATGALTGVVVNYRGLTVGGAGDCNGCCFLVVNDSCHGFLVGDVIRRVRPDEAIVNASLQFKDWVLADADTFDNTQAVGVVTERTPDWFKIALTGRISNLKNLIPGNVYYLSTTIPVPDPMGTIDTTTNSIAMIGGFSTNPYGPRETQRNVVTITPNCPYFSRPMYVAISTTDAVMYNQRTLPDPHVSFNRDCVCADCTDNVDSTFHGLFEFDRPQKPGFAQVGGGNEEVAATLSSFANFLFSGIPVSANDTCVIYWTDPNQPNDSSRQKWRMKFLNGSWVLDTNQTF